jgi:hypothetical protein
MTYSFSNSIKQAIDYWWLLLLTGLILIANGYRFTMVFTSKVLYHC